MNRLSQQQTYSKSKSKKYANLGPILYLNIVILLNTSFGLAATQISPEIADQMNFTSLGQAIVLCQYLVAIIGNIFGILYIFIIKAPIYLKELTYKYAFLITASAGLTQCLAGLFLVWAYHQGFGQGITYIVCLSIACINGWFYGGLWVIYSLYISENTNDSNKAIFYGIGNSICNSAGIFGSIVSIFLIGPLGEFYYFFTLFFLSLGTQCLYFFVVQPNKENKDLENEMIPQHTNDDSSPEIKEKIYYNNIQRKIQKNKNIPKKSEYEDVKIYNSFPIGQQIRSIWKIGISQKIRPLIPYMISTGVVLGFENGVYYKLIKETILNTYPMATNTEIYVDTFIVFAGQGLMEVFGGVLIGIIGNYYLINYTSVIQNNWIQLVLYVTLADCFLLNYNVAIAFGFMWGLADCAGEANCMSLISEDWGDDIRAFGVCNIMQNTGAIIAILLSIIMGDSQFYFYLLIIIFWMIYTNFQINNYRRNRRIVDDCSID